MATIVTAFFDINREKKGDGRTITDYLSWFNKTLQLNCNMYIITEEKFRKFVEENRPKNYNTYVKIDILENASYYKYRERMIEILESQEYKNRIAHPNRVECKLPEYNIIQYSKFGWLEETIKNNPFNTEYFFWMDAGISRFFLDINIQKIYPQMTLINQSKNKFIIQQRHDLLTYNITNDFIWKSDNLLKGTMFGGHKDIVLKIGELLEIEFNNSMLNNNNVNNEQLGLALVYKKYPELFFLTKDIEGIHLYLFKLLSI